VFGFEQLDFSPKNNDLAIRAAKGVRIGTLLGRRARATTLRCESRKLNISSQLEEK